ncbi:MAG: hypothetical protein R2711_15100 [Acidimicrobiales bacterium]
MPGRQPDAEGHEASRALVDHHLDGHLAPGGERQGERRRSEAGAASPRGPRRSAPTRRRGWRDLDVSGHPPIRPHACEDAGMADRPLVLLLRGFTQTGAS